MCAHYCCENTVLETVISLSLNNIEAEMKLNGNIGELVNNVWFVDDIGFLTRSEPELQDIMTQADETSTGFRRVINADFQNQNNGAWPKRNQHPRRSHRASWTNFYLERLINTYGSNDKDIQRYLTSIWNDEHNVEKKRLNKENQD